MERARGRRGGLGEQRGVGKWEAGEAGEAAGGAVGGEAEDGAVGGKVGEAFSRLGADFGLVSIRGVAKL